MKGLPRLLALAASAEALLLAVACGTQSSPFDGGTGGTGNGSGSGGGSGYGSFGSSSGLGTGYRGDGGPCVNLQCRQVDCSSQGKAPDATTLSGTVYDPAAMNPVYNAIVYVPNEPVKPFTRGVVCDKCGVLTTGNPVVSALSDPTGQFVLRNVPVGADVPLVVQIGKWRRQTTIAMVNECTDNPVADRNLTRLPASQAEGDLPQIALATGGCDAFECLLQKMGVAVSEFTPSTGGGRIHVYQGLNGIGLYQSAPATALWSDVNVMKKYDLIINSCECSEQAQEKTSAMLQNHQDYAGAGGRVFDTHFNYYWINHGPPPFPSTATFAPNSPGPDPTTGTVDTSFPKGDALATWLVATGASSVKGQIGITQAKYDVVSSPPPSTRWIFGSSAAGPSVFHYTFNTPVGVPDDAQCGKVLFSDFHAAAGSNMQQVTFPMECNGNPLTPQEAALEFMIFDLSSCIQIDTQPPVAPVY